VSFPRYSKYKPSGVEWLGDVPEEWALKRIGNFFTERREKVSDKVFPALSVTMGGIVPQIDTAAKTDDGDNRKKVCQGDFVINSRSDRKGSSGASELDGSVSLISIVLQPHDPGAVHMPFVHHLLRSQLFQEEFYRNGKGIVADLWSTNFSAMRNILLGMPDLPEQTAIAAFLNRETGKIDALVAEQRRLMELLKEKRLAVISHAVTRGLNPDVPLKPSGIEWLGDVPEHWEVIALKRIADIQTGVAKGKDNSARNTITVPYLRVANVQDGYLDLETVANIEIPDEDLGRYSLKRGDVLMNEGGDFDKLGRGCVWDGQIDPCITQNHVFAVRPRLVASAWLNAITSSDFAQFYFMTRSKQSTNLASISSTNLMELPVILPPPEEQQNILSFIADKTSRFDTLTAEAQRAIDLLQERRTALISAAVTGQIDVRKIPPKKAA